jgi:hypothetical protein
MLRACAMLMADRPKPVPPGQLSAQAREHIRAAVLALPPLTDEQIDALCEVIANARIRRQADTTTSSHSTRRAA